MKNINNSSVLKSVRYVNGYILAGVLCLVLGHSAGAGLGMRLEDMQKTFGPLKWSDFPVFSSNHTAAAVFIKSTDHVWTMAVFKEQLNDMVVVEEVHSAEKGFDIKPSMIQRLMDLATPHNDWKPVISSGGNEYFWRGQTFICRFGLAYKLADDSALCLVHRSKDGKVNYLQFISAAAASRRRWLILP